MILFSEASKFNVSLLCSTIYIIHGNPIFNYFLIFPVDNEVQEIILQVANDPGTNVYLIIKLSIVCVHRMTPSTKF